MPPETGQGDGAHQFLSERLLMKEALMTENDLVHDCKLAFTSKNSEGKGYSTGSTFFIKSHEKPLLARVLGSGSVQISRQ